MIKQPTVEGESAENNLLPAEYPGLSPDFFLGETELQRMLHELQMNQIELENQNEELRRSQHDLEISQARYFELYALAPVSYITLNKRGIILEANLAASTLLGVEMARLVRQQLSCFIHPEDRDLFFMLRTQLLETAAQQTLEARILDASGAQLWVKLDAVAAQNVETGEFECNIVMSDITERKYADEALRESEEKYRAMIEVFDGFMYICSKEFRIEYMNDNLIRRTGRDATGEYCFKALHDLDAVCEWCVNDQVFAGNTVHWKVQSPKDDRWYEINNSPIYKADGTVSKQAMITDITECMQTGIALMEAHQFSEQIISGAQEGVIVFDLELRYLVWNPFMEEMTGMKAGEVIGRHPSEVFPFLLATGFIERLERALSGETSDFTDFQYAVPETGKSGWTSSASAPLRNTKGEIVGVITTVREITGRKRMEDELRQALEAEESANATMSRLLRIIAHEFRSPLGVLSGSTDILDHYRDRLTPEKRFELHEHIRNASSKLTDLISSVTAFNRLGAEGAGGNPLLLDVGEVCSAVTAGVESVWGTGQKCTLTIAPDCGAALLDEALFRRVVENLLTNAFRYTPADGCVSFYVRRDGERLLLDVVDTGIGIPEEDQPLIFDAFYRSRNVEWRGGLGLGLSIVRDALLQLDGTITVNSKAGKGTTMRVDIPVVDPAKKNAARVSGAESCTQF